MKIVAIIPARGGSKGISKKNIKLLMGKPLIAYTIEEADKVKKLNKVIVSTENDEIAKVSKEYKAEIIPRPIELAKDDTPTIDVIFHVMSQLNKDFDNSTIIVLLQPTSPLRTANDIENGLDLFLNNKCDSVISVCEVDHPPYWSLKIEGGILKPLFGIDSFIKQRQGYEKIYYPNGALFIATFKILDKYKTFLCNNTIPYIMPAERSLDIDNEIDFKLAEVILTK